MEKVYEIIKNKFNHGAREAMHLKIFKRIKILRALSVLSGLEK